MNIRYCIPTLNQIQWVVDEHLPSIDYSLITGLHLHISDYEDQRYNGGGLGNFTDIPAVSDLMDLANVHFRVTSTGDNLGVSPSWNKFIQEAKRDGYDAVIIANDDIRLNSGALSRFVEAMEENQFVYFDGQNAFGFFGFHLSLAESVGYFDENFWPAYFEDNDYFYRMQLADVVMRAVNPPSYFHAGSATTGAFGAERKIMHFHNFQKNKQYYMTKWGGMPHEERYTRPFGD